ncbi:MAG: hypothetical protein AAF335_03435 [Bacteroidota bacterium]
MEASCDLMSQSNSSFRYSTYADRYSYRGSLYTNTLSACISWAQGKKQSIATQAIFDPYGWRISPIFLKRCAAFLDACSAFCSPL